MFRELSEGEKANFRAWARKNYIPGDDISELWHPVIQSECDAMNYEARQAYRFETVYYVGDAQWASYLINGDASGIEPSDITEANAFVHRVGLGAPTDAVGDTFFDGKRERINYSFFRKVKVSR